VNEKNLAVLKRYISAYGGVVLNSFSKDLDFIITDLPTLNDILLVSNRTMDTVEKDLEIDETKFCFVDIGNQRNDRRRWTQNFKFVTTLIYVVSLTSYDEVTVDQPDKNVMLESLQTFSTIINNTFFDETSVVLFLNKKDLFFEKIDKVPLTVCFKDFQIIADEDPKSQALSFIKDKYVNSNTSTTRPVFAHLTCAIDTENMKHVLGSTQNILLESNISGCLL